tara:strand:+ start:230 stop:946 length:717 start_codon:yes stop_codon:yes gene_type:complete
MIIVIVSYALMHTIEIASIGSRVAGRLKKRVALGTTLQQSIKTISVFLLVPFLPALGFLVESGILIDDYIMLFLLSFVLSFIASITMIYKLNRVQNFFQKVFINYKSRTIPVALWKSFFKNKMNFDSEHCEPFSFNKVVIKKTLVSFIAYLFLTTGFFIAFFLAILYPENRLTLSQFTATFHGFGAVIFAFYIDPMLSRSIDTMENKEAWIKNIYSILVGRSLSYLTVIMFLIIYYLF